MKVLVVENLRKSYGKVVAVDGISFEVEEGTVFSLLGPNGAGKTTTVETVLGLRKKDSGRILIFGSEGLGRSEKERIGVMFQESAIFDNLKVWENLELVRSVYGRGFDVDEVLEMLGLEKVKGRLARKLSGGQRRRLAFGMAIIGDPDLLFLDEPTTGLDPQARRRVWEIIEDFRSREKTIFLTTHYMEEAQTLSDTVCIMDHGKIVEMGSVNEIIERSGLPSVVEAVVDGKSVRLETSDPERKIEELFNDGKIEKLIVRRPNLEDVFLKITGRSLRE